mmetsp:Transcript_64982/g.209302  ORF Transcript_64982/g.209302 Transcript_64982/m.209302 type:complete len:947 (-) Transcript_64982:12-2852(-)
MGKSKAAKVQVPECRYGAACTRRDCIFRHPSKKEKQQAPHQEKTDKICFAFVAGGCAFGRLCHDRHPDEASCRTIRERYGKIDCQWGRNCRTEGCLYQHPSDEPAGPAMPQEPARPQPAIFAEGPRIVPQQASPEESRVRAVQATQRQAPKAISQATDLRDTSAFDIADPLERFLAVNMHNTGTQSAALLDLHCQSTQSFASVLDEVLPERLQMFPEDGVWIMTGAGQGQSAPSKPLQRSAEGHGLFEAVQEYLTQRCYEFTMGPGTDGAFLVRPRKKPQDPLEGVRAVLLCGVPGSGKSALAVALAHKSGGRFVRVCQDELRGDRAACEEAFQRALADAAQAAGEERERAKAGTWWWEHAFDSGRFYLAVCFRATALSFLQECCGVSLPRAEHFHATLAYQPTGLDLRRQLGRPYRVSFRCHLVLEGTAAPHVGELFEVLLCSARAVDGSAGGRPLPLHVTLAGPRAAARQLQVLNAMALEKRILANSTLGSFKVRRVVDLTGSGERLGLCLLLYKAGDHRDMPAPVSFDVPCLLSAAGAGSTARPGAARWTELGDAALASLDPLVVLEEVHGESEHEWSKALAGRCAALGFRTPQLQLSRPMGPTESKLAQWTRLRPSCLLHCAAEEADIAHMLQEGAAVMRSSGAVALPPQCRAYEVQALPRVVLLDRCNLERVDRRQWAQLGGLQRSEVVVLHLDLPEAECIERLARRGAQHPTLKVASAAEAEAAVRSQAEQLEPPAEREGFRAIMRLRGGPAAQELVRRWVQGAMAEPCASEPEQCLTAGEDTVQEPGGARPVWGLPWGCPVDAPLGAPLEGLLEASGQQTEPPAYEPLLLAPSAQRQGPRAAWPPPDTAAAPPPPRPSPAAAASHAQAPEIPWPPMEPEAPGGARQEEDAEERARQEQLAATLRCMGFDEEPSLHAALRAGGNLNVAVESVLQSSGTAQ